MDVEFFVRDTLCQIVRAVISANQELTKHGAEVCPQIKTPQDAQIRAGRDVSARGLPVREVQFDLAVTVSEEKQKGGDLRIAIQVLKFGAEGKAKATDERQSRIRFAIPLTFPQLTHKGT